MLIDSSILLTSTPPAWAKSGLPPPPFPPMISDPFFTKSTALYFLVKPSVIPTARPILPSLVANITTTPSPKSFFPLSTNFLSSLVGRPSTFWNLTLISLIVSS